MSGFKPGHDGQPPVFRPMRGSEVLDAKTGKVIREAADGVLNVNCDRLEWLFQHGKITKCQHEAGQRLQGDWEQSKIIAYSSAERGFGCTGGNRLPDVKLDAMTRFGNARRHVGQSSWRVIELVLLNNVSLGKVEGLLHLPRQSAMGYLAGGLDALASHYGFSTWA